MSLEIIGAFLTGGSFVALINLFQWWVDRRDKKTEKKFPNILSGIHEVYHIINVILRETDAHRVVVNRVENGGTIPAVGKDLYETVVYEAYDEEMSSIKKKWQRQPVDRAHVQLLLRIAEQSNVLVVTDKLPSCNIKDNYEAGGVTMADKYLVRSKEGAFYYLCVHFAEVKELSPAYRDLLRYSVNELHRLIR